MNGPLVIVEPYLVDPDAAQDMVGGREIFDRMLKNAWFKPRIKQPRLVRYAPTDLSAAVDRLLLEDLPE